MFVKNMMIPKKDCITVEKGTSIGAALAILKDHNIKAVPVLEGEYYVGTITRLHIYERFFHDDLNDRKQFLQETKVEDVAGKSIKRTNDVVLFEHILFEFKDFPQLAVINERDEFTGLITRSDVLEEFAGAFGLRSPGIRIALTSVETKGRLAKLADISRDLDERIISLITFDETDKLVRRIVLKVEKSKNINRYIEKLESSGFRILDIYDDTNHHS